MCPTVFYSLAYDDFCISKAFLKIFLAAKPFAYFIFSPLLEIMFVYIFYHIYRKHTIEQQEKSLAFLSTVNCLRKLGGHALYPHV